MTGKKHGLTSPESIRASITFPADHYQVLEEIAKKKKVSLAWVVRDAVESYLTRERRHCLARPVKRLAGNEGMV